VKPPVEGDKPPLWRGLSLPSEGLNLTRGLSASLDRGLYLSGEGIKPPCEWG